MLATYSPHRESGSTMQLHSPSSQYDPHSAIREIRRSLSRSPSKPYSFRSAPPNGTIPFSPSPLSPSRRSSSENTFQLQSLYTTTPGRFVQPSRIQRPVIRRTTQAQGISRTRTSPKSPSKRALSEVNETNSFTPPLRKRNSTEIEDDHYIGIEDKENVSSQNEDQITMWKTAQTRQEKRRSGGLLNEISPLSPMKRSDGSMHLDQPNFGSPSAKRRSMHGPTSLDFSIFDSDALKESFEQRRSQDDSDYFRQSPHSPSGRFSTIPKRSSSLRKSTLQQRQNEKHSPFRINQFPDTGQNLFDTTPSPFLKKTGRISLDNHLPPMQRESPFSSQGALLSASVHPIQSSQDSSSGQSSSFRHPLSRTLTESSSTPSVQDDSPTHEPIRRPKSHDFSKSLPVGASRPTVETSAEHAEFSSQGSFATPATYKFARPLPAAFMSTGLISKKNRNVDEPHAGLPKAHMPDTPCKRQALVFPVNKKVATANAAAHNLRQSSFGTPKISVGTPYGLPRASPFPWAKNTSIFGVRARPGLTRKSSFASFVSIETDNKPNSHTPSAQGDSQSTDPDYPPTPTKPMNNELNRTSSVSPSPHHSVTYQRIGHDTSHGICFQNITPHLSELDTSSPHTPLEGYFPPDPSSLSISAKADRPTTRNGSIPAAIIPATPTGPREQFGNFSNRPSLNLNAPEITDVDSSLTIRFDKVDLVGTGEFSQVYRVSQPADVSPFKSCWPNARSSSRNSLPEKVFAVKKSRYPYSGPKDRARKVHEVDVLKTLGHNDHILAFYESWEDHGHLYIQTEFCEEGTLDTFLAQAGLKARLDDFRIWKILLELSLGLKHIHDNNFIHLDLKPANVLITFEGVLKIGDFGMATKWPAKSGIDGEGDREYIGPEILMGKYDKPADVFALGLIMLETAGNVELPDNGLSWQKLRNGDMSDVPSLTWSSEDSNILRDASGDPLTDEDGSEDDSLECIPSGQEAMNDYRDKKQGYLVRSGELLHPPEFMTDANNEQALDSLVRWMISPSPGDRPVMDEILQTTGVMWVESRRRAGATIFEGNWGPADDVLAEDAEMIDV